MQKKHLIIIGIVLFIVMASAFVFVVTNNIINDKEQIKSSEFVPVCTDELNAKGVVQCASVP